MSDLKKCCRIDVDIDLLSEAKDYISLEEQSILDNARIFSLLSNEVRLKIITLFLKFERLCVCDLGDVLDMKQSPISQHLRKLKDGGLLGNKREGMTIFYFITDEYRDKLEAIIKG